MDVELHCNFDNQFWAFFMFSSSNSPLKPLSRVAVEFDAFIDDILNPFHATKCRFLIAYFLIFFDIGIFNYS